MLPHKCIEIPHLNLLLPLQIEQEFGISSPSRLPRGITPLNDTSSTLKDDLNNTLKYTDVESSTPVKGQIGAVPDSPALSVIDPDQSSLEVSFYCWVFVESFGMVER